MTASPATTTALGALTFSDISGFTRFTREAGDVAAFALLEEFEAIVAASLPADARIVKSLGDGVLTFVPDPGAALRSAVEQQARFAEVGSVERPLWVRTGVHFGSPLRRGDDFVGHDVNLAARVADQAMPGEVLATYETVVAAGHGDGARPPGLVIGEVGPVFVKGVDDPVRLFRVSGMPMKTG